MNKWHGIVRWTLDDVIEAAKSNNIEMTKEEAEEWWLKNETAFIQRMMELGNEVLGLMTEEIRVVKQ